MKFVFFIGILALSIFLSESITIDPVNPKIAPLLSVNINQSSIGTWTRYLPGKKGEENINTLFKLSSKWMQNDKTHELYISIGEKDLGDQFCFGKFWFVDKKHYVLSYNNSDCSATPTCQCISEFGYEEEVSYYNSTFLAYLGRSYSYKFGQEVDSYAGRTLDGVGPLTVVMHINNGSYVGLTTLENEFITGSNPNIAYYNEYFYNEINKTIPDIKYSIIPQVCVEFEKKFNCTPHSTQIGKKNGKDSENHLKYLKNLVIVLIFALMILF